MVDLGLDLIPIVKRNLNKRVNVRKPAIFKHLEETC